MGRGKLSENRSIVASISFSPFLSLSLSLSLSHTHSVSVSWEAVQNQLKCENTQTLDERTAVLPFQPFFQYRLSLPRLLAHTHTQAKPSPLTHSLCFLCAQVWPLLYPQGLQGQRCGAGPIVTRVCLTITPCSWMLFCYCSPAVLLVDNLANFIKLCPAFCSPPPSPPSSRPVVARSSL